MDTSDVLEDDYAEEKKEVQPASVGHIPALKGQPQHPVFHSLGPLSSSVHAVVFDPHTGRPVERQQARDLEKQLKELEEQHAEKIAALQKQLKDKSDREEMERNKQTHSRDMDVRRLEWEREKAELHADLARTKTALEADLRQAKADLERANADWQRTQDELKTERHAREDERKKVMDEHTRDMERERNELAREKVENEQLQKQAALQQTIQAKLMELANAKERDDKKGELQKLLASWKRADEKEARSLKEELEKNKLLNKQLEVQLERERKDAAEMRALEFKKSDAEAKRQLEQQRLALTKEVQTNNAVLQAERVELEKKAAALRAEHAAVTNALTQRKLELAQANEDRNFQFRLQELEAKGAREDVKLKLLAEKQAHEGEIKKAQLKTQEEASAAKRDILALQLQLQAIKNAGQEQLQKAQKDADAARAARTAEASKAASLKDELAIEKKKLENANQQVKNEMERMKAAAVAAQAEATRLREERDGRLKEMQAAWARVNDQFQMQIQGAKAFDERRLTEDKLRKSAEDSKLAMDIAGTIAKCTKIIQTLTADTNDAPSSDGMDATALLDPNSAAATTESMEVDEKQVVYDTRKVEEYLKEAAALIKEIDTNMTRMLQAVLPKSQVTEVRTLPRIRATADLLQREVATVREDVSNISRNHRQNLKDPQKKQHADWLFKEGSFSNMILWFAEAAEHNPMHRELTKMWHTKAQTYQARFAVARAVLAAIWGLLDEEKETNPRLQGTPSEMKLPPPKAPSLQKRRRQIMAGLTTAPMETAGNALGGLRRRRKARASAAEQQPAVTGGGTDDLKQQAAGMSHFLQPPPSAAAAASRGAPAPAPMQPTTEALRMVVDGIIEDVRRHVADMKEDDMFWKDASATAYGDFTSLQQYTQGWSYEILERLQELGVASPEAAVLTAIQVILEVFGRTADQSEGGNAAFNIDGLLSQIQVRASKIVTAAKKMRKEQADGFQKIDKAIYDTCVFWNGYFPFNIIDALTAEWAAVRAAVLEIRYRDDGVDAMWHALERYDASITTQFTAYQTILSTRPADEDSMPNAPLISRRFKEMDRHTQIVKERELIEKKMQTWREQIDGNSSNAHKVIQRIKAMTDEMRYIVGKDVAELRPGTAPFLTQNVPDLMTWLDDWRDAAKDGYKQFEQIYKRLNTALTKLSDKSDIRVEQKGVFDDLASFQDLATAVDRCVSDLDEVRERVQKRIQKWESVLKQSSTHQVLLDEYAQLQVEPTIIPFLSGAEKFTSAAIAQYLESTIGMAQDKAFKLAEAKHKGSSKAAVAVVDPEAAPHGHAVISRQIMLYESSRPSWRFVRVLEFAKLLAGSVPVVPDSIVDMSVVLVGHPEVRQEAIFSHLADGTAEKETAALRLMQGTALANFENEDKRNPKPDMFGMPSGDAAVAAVAAATEADAKAAEKDDKDRVARIGKAILDRIDELRQMLANNAAFDDALLGILTPYGAASVLTSWHLLQKSSRLYEKRSLAQMICAADLRVRTKFAQFCANQYNATDKRRPTRHAHGIDFANEINLEYDAIGRFLVTQVRWNPHVRDADNCAESPWIICRATSS
jgi:hypothetical protein